jgi:DNA-binding transcriptional LysR family regulator
VALDIRLIMQFAVVADHLSFTRAASLLGVPQPWLSTRIRKLEEQVGVPLLLRNTRRVELTEDGRDLLERSRPLIGAARDVEAFLEMLRGGPDLLRLGIPPYSHIIPERVALINEFVARWPKTSLELDVGWAPVLRDRVHKGALDLAFIIEASLPPDMEAITVSEAGLDLLLDPADSLSDFAEVPLDLLRGRRLAVFTRRLNPELFDRLFAPVARAGGELVQIPNHGDIDESGSGHEADLIIVRFGWRTPSSEQQAGRIARCMQMTSPLRLQLVRRCETLRPSAERLWQLARDRPHQRG